MARESPFAADRVTSVISLCDGFRKGLWETFSMWMWTDSEGVIVGLSCLVPVIGLCGVIAARLRTAHQPKQRSDWFVLLCFAIVGTASVLLMQQCNGCWLALATTMPLMAVGATLDLKKAPRHAAF